MIWIETNVELARGQVSDRPWGQTLGALGVRGLNGQLTVYADDGKQYRIAFERGAVVGATSPLSSDSAARVALTNHLITSSQVTQIARAVAARPDEDELDVLASACRLDADRALRLRQRVIAQRAARTFAVETGMFVVHEAIAIPAVRAAAVDIRAVVYLGVRMNLSEQRLAADLRELGSYFTLKPEAEDDLLQFGFTTSERPILEAMRKGTTLPELEAKHRELDPRSVQSVIYSLVSCFACEVMQTTGELDEPPTAEMPQTSAATLDATNFEGIFIKRERSFSSPLPASSPSADWAGAEGTPGQRRTPTGDPVVGRSTTRPTLARTDTQPVLPRTETPRSTRVFDDPTPRIEPTRTRTLDSADRPVMFSSRAQSPSGELPAQPPPAQTRTTSLTGSPLTGRAPSSPPAPLNRPATGPIATPRSSASLPPQNQPAVGRAPSTPPPLHDAHPPVTTEEPTMRSRPSPLPSRTPTPSVAPPRAAGASIAPPTAPRVLTPADAASASGQFPTIKPGDVEEPSGGKTLALAAEAFARGNAALRDDQIPLAIEELGKAAELNPHNFDYCAMYAWAQFCGSDDRARVADKVRKMLNYAIQKSTNPELARFYLGRMERMLGRYKEALHHFKAVVDTQPRNADAQAEIRQIEARIAAGSGEKPGLAGLFSRKKDKDK